MHIKKIGFMVFVLQYCAASYAVVTEGNRLYLENFYGAPIMCRVVNGNTSNDYMLRTRAENTIYNQDRKLLGIIPHSKNVQSVDKRVTSIDIKATNVYSAGYASLNNYLMFLSDAINSCCNSTVVPEKYRDYCEKNKICNKDAVIVIYPSSVVSGWKIDVQWRDPSRQVIAK